jgi:hypothetical protein
LTPHEHLFGIKPNIPGVLQRDPLEIRYNYNSYVQELQSRLQSCYEVARSNLRAKKEKSRNTMIRIYMSHCSLHERRYCYTMRKYVALGQQN